MALQTKVITSTRTSRGYLLTLTLNEDSIDVVNNTSSISYSLTISSNNYTYSQYGTGWNVIIDGSSVNYHAREQTSTNPRIDTAVTKLNTEVLICSGTKTIAHSADGTKTIAAADISATLDIALSTAGPGPMSLAADSAWTLTTIARKSTLSIGNGTLGTARSMTVTTASSSFTHTLAYTCGSASGTMFTKQAASAITSYTFPKTLAAQNTRGASVSVTVTITTYSGSTSLGSNSYTISMTIPNDSTTKPTIGTITTGEPSGQSHISTHGGYIQNVSRMTVSFSPSGYQGATIASSSIKIGSMYTYSGTSATSGVLSTSGTITITVSATDTRGFTNTGTKTITVLAYSQPSITNVALTRTDANGNALASGAYGTITFKATGTNITGNTMTYKAYYRASTTSSYSSTTLSGYSNNYNVTSGKYAFSASVNNSWYAYITVQDKFYTTTSTVVNMPSQEAYFKMDPVKKAMSIGTIETTANTLRIAWNTVYNNSIQVLGKDSRMDYMPYTWHTNGGADNTVGYARIASVTCNTTWLYGNTMFVVQRMFDDRAVRLFLRFETNSDTIADTINLRYDSIGATGGSYGFEAFACKQSSNSSTVDVYVRKSHANGWITVTTYPSKLVRDRCTFTYVPTIVSSVISGATVATQA